jgi:hypothetical protein
MESDRKLCLEIVHGRERADRLLKRAASDVQNDDTENLSISAIEACTANTLVNCISFVFIDLKLLSPIQRRVSFLLLAADIWT